ncbi:MAG: sigma-70 family RNA polymerase sigma factor [Bacteroidaceae bacterium]|nr:sigma-70 family RNA polymerase sigma factor [Bacteroidaceae bacterium]
MTTETEISLVEGLRKQSPKTQRHVLERYGGFVFSQVARLVPGNEDAEEVYQDVFVKVFSNIENFDASKSSFQTWLYRIAYNTSVSFLRQKRQPMIYFEDNEGKAEAISEDEVEATFGHASQETVMLIRAALKHLPPDERAIITMFYFDDMSIKEIAYVTEASSTGVICSKLQRTRKKLCKIIQMLRS